MNNIKKTILLLSLVIIVLSGCNINVPEDMLPDTFTASNKKANSSDPVPKDNRKRFTSSTADNSSYEEARDWAVKFKELKAKSVQLKKYNSELTADNKRLAKRFDSMRANLEITEQELSDANDMLIEQRKELVNWKTNVLGFREESNYVHKEQLKALVKILKLLGAEYEDTGDQASL